MTSAKHFDAKWREVISQMPQGGDYCFYMRQYGYDIIKDVIKPYSYIFDFACGLGVIDGQLAREKGCKCSGADISSVAAMYAINENQMLHVSKDTFFKKSLLPPPSLIRVIANICSVIKLTRYPPINNTSDISGELAFVPVP